MQQVKARVVSHKLLELFEVESRTYRCQTLNLVFIRRIWAFAAQRTSYENQSRSEWLFQRGVEFNKNKAVANDNRHGFRCHLHKLQGRSQIIVGVGFLKLCK